MHSASELSGLRDVLDSRVVFAVMAFYPSSSFSSLFETENGWILCIVREIANYCLSGLRSLHSECTLVFLSFL